MTRFAIFFLCMIIILAILAPHIAPYDPMQIIAQPEQPPNMQHIFGTDSLGRDVLSRMLFGGSRTLLIAASASVIVMLPGLILGMLAGVLGGWIDRFIQIMVNTALAIPSLVIALVILTLTGQGEQQLALATGFSLIPLYIQVTRSIVRQIYQEGYIESAIAAGAGTWGLLVRHILPNSLPVLLAYGGVIFSYCLINSAGLSFLGLGGEPGIPDWGVMLAEGRSAFRTAPWLGIIPGIAVFLTVFSVNTLTSKS